MKYRALGRTGWQISTVSFGAWAIGDAWGKTDDRESKATLSRALDLGVNFFDTADVYGDGRSERLLGELRRERKEPFYVATKAGRRLQPHIADGYNKGNLTAFVERSQKISASMPWICCSSTVRRPTSTTDPKSAVCSRISRRPARFASTA